MSKSGGDDEPAGWHSGQVRQMKLIKRNKSFILQLLPNFSIHIPNKNIRIIDEKYAIVYFDGMPILAELQQ
jgi:hypothetical protein